VDSSMLTSLATLLKWLVMSCCPNSWDLLTWWILLNTYPDSFWFCDISRDFGWLSVKLVFN
jgi:hypothetical protein